MIGVCAVLVAAIVSSNVYANSAQSKVKNEFTRPNILWLVLEDMSPIIKAYGDNTAYTPNIDWLAEQGVKYTNAYSTSGVCAPSRAGLALGMYPSSVGAITCVPPHTQK
ncbi:sulfatase-like hydrolase/transferase [Paraglaciecola aquimarina]|uniref:Sulfatase-like hydrolase/transferase n=1 Tax=Paraglaciecola aquimarina TaxID=1235557 RepID=A0ABU3SRD7_9ALTE|nr:sulfatase-like hydrolase/transferase [Paraglaciecola aquimarina]MDU0352570.1 sulfatase-like hydrolase/transferase [Paraglaciecola aquimarina]